MRPLLPIACSLDGGDFNERREQWRTLLEDGVAQSAPVAGGVRITLRSSRQIRADLARLISLERACCSWIRWDVHDDGRLIVDATASRDEGTALLRMWFLTGRSPSST